MFRETKLAEARHKSGPTNQGLPLSRQSRYVPLLSIDTPQELQRWLFLYNTRWQLLHCPTDNGQEGATPWESTVFRIKGEPGQTGGFIPPIVSDGQHTRSIYTYDGTFVRRPLYISLYLSVIYIWSCWGKIKLLCCFICYVRGDGRTMILIRQGIRRLHPPIISIAVHTPPTFKESTYLYMIINQALYR